MKIVISMPLYIEIGVKKRKKYYINLNQYRNWHYQVANNIKKAYQRIAYDNLKEFRFLKADKIELTFTLWKRDKRKIDRANALSIHEKFFCDALTGLQIIEDDNDKHIYATHYYTGGIDKDNPRVDIEVSIL